MQLTPDDIESFKPFLDKFGLIAQKASSGADGGDSAHRFGVAYAALKLGGYDTWLDGTTPLDEYYHKAMLDYEKSKNTYVRHPDPDKWYSNPQNFSRDQTDMLMKAMLVQGDKSRLRGLFKEIIKNFGFHKNIYPNHTKPGDPEYKKKTADILTPSQIADVLRSYKSKALYPVLCVLDAFRFIDVYLAKRDDDKSKLKGKRTDYYVMLATGIAVSRAVQDTFVLRAVSRKLNASDYKLSVDWIFGPLWDDPPLHRTLLRVLFQKHIDDADL